MIDWDALNKAAELYGNGRPYQAAVHFQITKLMEEVGEVAAAFIGVTGQNLRKGHTHSYTDVAEETCDCIITALVLLSTITYPGDARMLLETQMRNKIGRMNAS